MSGKIKTLDLRQAIIDANATQGDHTINFSISGNDPHAIALESSLPNVGVATCASHSITLDACAQKYGLMQ